MTTSNATPRYRRLYQQLRRDITTGVYAPGELLPSENELCRRLNITRPTVRQGLAELVREGLIHKVRGKGSIVQTYRPPSGIGILNIRGTTDSLPDGQLTTRVVVPPCRRPWLPRLPFDLPAEVAAAPCIFLSRVRSLAGQPIFYEETMLPAEGLQGLVGTDLNDRSFFGCLRDEHGLEVIGGHQRIRAIHPDAQIQRLLAVRGDTPILRLDKHYRTSRPNYSFYTSIWCDTRSYYLEGDL